MSIPIDIVILWVDGSDLKWREKKKKWQKKYGIFNDEEERYRDWGNLHILFRTIERFAPWYNHIYLVTDNQSPDWLKKDHPKVTIVDHSDIIDDKYLPTFNSQVIELNIHKIPGLSEHFLYFNDDMFLLQPVEKEDFFENGNPKLSASLNVIMPFNYNIISSVNFNNTALINSTFDKKTTIKNKPRNWFNWKYGIENIRTLLLLPWPHFTSFKQHHLIGIFKKSVFEEVFEYHGEQIVSTFPSKFREKNNYNQWLIRDWHLASNQFKPQSKNFGQKFQLSDHKSVSKCEKHILRAKTKLICVNDTELLEDFDSARVIINKAFLKHVPNKSSFEM